MLDMCLRLGKIQCQISFEVYPKKRRFNDKPIRVNKMVLGTEVPFEVRNLRGKTTEKRSLNQKNKKSLSQCFLLVNKEGSF